MEASNFKCSVSEPIDVDSTLNPSSQYILYERYQDDIERYLTFDDEIPHKVKEKAARNGFITYKLESESTIKCIYCNLQFSLQTLLEIIEILEEEHERNSPRCMIVTKDGSNEFKLQNYETINSFYVNKNLYLESHRLLSFFQKNWPKLPNNEFNVGALDLAKFGFVHVGISDGARCHFCLLEISGWEKNDNVVREHLKYSSGCPLLLERTDKNIPIGKGLKFLFPNRKSQFEIEIKDIPGGKHPHYDTYDKRFATFEHWPRNFKISKEELSSAGFYYFGQGDRVKCYYCGLGLQNWSQNDNVWTEHAVWTTDCQFMISNKGQKFIDECKKTFEENKAKRHAECREDCCKMEEAEKTSTVVEEPAEPQSTRRLCKICLDKPLEIVFLPCAHLCCCVECALQTKFCPVCRKVPLAVKTTSLPN